MFTGKTKHEVSDPAFYDSLIAEQKKRVRQHSQDEEQWLELGRLRESKLVKPFVGYLNGKKSDFLRINQTSTTKDGTSYYTYLARVADQINYPEVNSLTLGQCHFALKLALEGDYVLSEYANFLNEICAASGTIIGRAFSEKLETVTHKYRNAIAHQSPMNKEEYEHLRGLIFVEEGALLIVVAAL